MLRFLISALGIAWGSLVLLLMSDGMWILAFPLLAGLLFYCWLALPVLRFKEAEARQRKTWKR